MVAVILRLTIGIDQLAMDIDSSRLISRFRQYRQPPLILEDRIAAIGRILY